MTTDVTAARREYAEQLRDVAQVRSDAVVRAFATVARERYLGPGPWLVFGFGPSGSWQYVSTPDANPVHLYRDVLIAIEPGRFLNNGQPSAHALWLDALDLHPGDRAVHVGSGTGYYTAIIAEIVGRNGRVTAIEIDPALARRARDNLAPLSSVDVVEGDGCQIDFGPADAIYVNAGATHPLPLWLDRLKPGGRLILPLVRWPASADEASASGAGVLLKITCDVDGLHARVVSLVYIFPCVGAIEAGADRALSDALRQGVETASCYIVRRDPHDRTPGCWLHGQGYCLARED